MRGRAFAAAIALVLAAGVARADEQARLAHIFQDNMVLQRDMPVPVWGWADPGTPVEVTFAGQRKRAMPDAGGRWRVTLDALGTSRDGRELRAKIGGAEVVRRNVLVGEVWIAAGQSNMNAPGPDRDTGVYPCHISPGTAGGKPEIRIMSYGWGASLDPLPDADPVLRGATPWQAVPENPPPARMNLAQYFSRVVRDGLDVPVGIIHVAVSGTNQVAWMSRATLESFPGSGGKKDFYEEFLATMEGNLAKSRGDIKSWQDFEKADAEWRKDPRGQWPGRAVAATLSDYPSALYNTRIHPLAPYALRGVIWHQGEAGPSGPYGARLVAMTKQWRELFGRDFCFVWGTLSRATTVSPPLEPLLSWFYRSNTNNQIRAALKLFGNDPRVALVEFYDLGDTGTHFEQKAEAGRRMGLAALSVAYGKDAVYTGPRLVESAVKGAAATLKFASVGTGIVYKPSIDGISGVIVKEKQGPFRWGEVRVLDKETVEVTLPGSGDLETIAYGVAINPHETLFNGEGLPASPFGMNTGVIPFKNEGTQMVSQTGPVKATLNVAHVRRDGYVFQLLNERGATAAKSTVQAYVGKEWAGYEVEVGGKPVPAQETAKDGLRFVTFEAPVGSGSTAPWIIVAVKGKAAEFRGVDRY